LNYFIYNLQHYKELYFKAAGLALQ
jgi:hypothetical protein